MTDVWFFFIKEMLFISWIRIKKDYEHLIRLQKICGKKYLRKKSSEMKFFERKKKCWQRESDWFVWMAFNQMILDGCLPNILIEIDCIIGIWFCCHDRVTHSLVQQMMASAIQTEHFLMNNFVFIVSKVNSISYHQQNYVK